MRIARVLVLASVSASVFASAAASAGVLRAQTSDRALALNGSYSVQAGAQEQLRQSVEAAVAPMNFVLRGVARRRLLALNQPSSRVDILVRGDSVVIRYSNQPELRAQRHGASRPWRNAAGESIAVAVRAAADAASSDPLLYERYTAEDGTRENRWFLDPSTGQARLEVTIASPRLPAPMRLQLRYTRAEPNPR